MPCEAESLPWYVSLEWIFNEFGSKWAVPSQPDCVLAVTDLLVAEPGLDTALAGKVFLVPFVFVLVFNSELFSFRQGGSRFRWSIISSHCCSVFFHPTIFLFLMLSLKCEGGSSVSASEFPNPFPFLNIGTLA